MKYVSQENLTLFTSKITSWVKNYVSGWFRDQTRIIKDIIQQYLPTQKTATIRKGNIQFRYATSFRVDFTEPMQNAEYAVFFMDYGDDYITVQPTVYSRDVNGFWARTVYWDPYVSGMHECMYMAIGEIK